MEMLFEEEQRQIQSISDRLQRDSNAIAVLVINKDGQEISRSGQTKDLDITSLSSLFAGNVAATTEIAKLLREEEFGGQFHEGTKFNVHISVVSRRAILISTRPSFTPPYWAAACRPAFSRKCARSVGFAIRSMPL